MAVNLARTTASAELLKQVFQNIDAYSCPRLFNFHTHTVYSDGRLQPSALMEQAIAIGLKGLAITDHHGIIGYQAAVAWLEDWKWSNPGATTPYLWSGVEINANLLDIEVHILAYAFAPEHPSMKPYLQRRPTTGQEYQASNVIAAIHEAGGLAVLAHPARYKRSHFDLIPGLHLKKVSMAWKLSMPTITLTLGNPAYWNQNKCKSWLMNTFFSIPVVLTPTV